MLSAEKIKQLARESGFGLVGIAPAAALDPGPLDRWLAAGMHAGMRWLEERREERLDPRVLHRGSRSVVALGCCFLTAGHLDASPIARYAQGRDYHATLRDRLRRLRRALLAVSPSLRTYSSVDILPVMERAWAERAGLGWIGRNAMLTTAEHGPNVLLGAMLLDDEVDRYDEPAQNRCGGCDACVRACPTGAIVAPGVVDSRRCLSYVTIEATQEPWAPQLREQAAGVAFGCDRCTRACPWDRPGHACDDERFAPREIATLGLEQLAALTPERHRELTQGTAVARAHFDGLRRNALIALGAARAPGLAALPASLLEDPSEIVREAARWALARRG
jgi:epoxyqueuosine reductase